MATEPEKRQPGAAQAPAQAGNDRERGELSPFGFRGFDRFFEDLFDDVFSRPFGRALGYPDLARRFGETARQMSPRVDVAETEAAWEITAELPGMAESDVDVSITDDSLTIKGEKTEKSEDKQKNYHVSERRYGSFQRSFRLPKGIDQGQIAATFENGVLKVHLPKSREALAGQRKIPIGKS